jgi:hypothetical protein
VNGLDFGPLPANPGFVRTACPLWVPCQTFPGLKWWRRWRVGSFHDLQIHHPGRLFFSSSSPCAPNGQGLHEQCGTPCTPCSPLTTLTQGSSHLDTYRYRGSPLPRASPTFRSHALLTDGQRGIVDIHFTTAVTGLSIAICHHEYE